LSSVSEGFIASAVGKLPVHKDKNPAGTSYLKLP